MQDTIRETSDRIWNRGSKLTHTQLDEILTELVAQATQKALEEKAKALNYLKILYLDVTNYKVDRITVMQRLNEAMQALSQQEGHK